MARTNPAECDIDLTAIMDREGIISIRRIRTPEGRFFEVITAAGSGMGMTVGAALDNAQRQPLPVAA
jgi:hypothetical protein